MAETVKLEIFKTEGLVKKEDYEFLNKHKEDFEKRFATRALFRSKAEMLGSVLNDAVHPTADSKYWQSIGEQNVHLTELANLHYEIKKQRADNEYLEAEIEEIEHNLKGAKGFEKKKLQATLNKKSAELEQSRFGLAQSNKMAQERIREIKHWEEIIQDLVPQLEYGTEDFELHHPKRYYLRYKNKVDNLQLADPSERKGFVDQFESFAHLYNDKQLPQSASVDFATIEELQKADKIADGYFSQKVKKILIGAPHRRKEDGNATNFNSMQTPAGFTVHIEQPFGYKVADAQNLIIEKAIEGGYDYVFFVEDDNIIPRDALVRLIHHKADVVGGLYYRKYLPLETAGMHYDKDGSPSSIEFEIGDVIHDTLVLPMGCTLIKTSVFEKMEKPYFKEATINGRPALTSDTYFCQRCRDIGVDIITDTSVQVLHVDKHNGKLFGHQSIIDYDNNWIKPEFRDYFAI